MPFSFNCPYCGTSTQVDERYQGTTGSCRNCGQTITVPGGPAASPYAPPARSGGGMVFWLAIAGAVLFGFLVLVGILVALLLPAVNAAREAARRAQCINNSRQIALAIINYESVNGHFPPAFTVDAEGKPLHSWRVLILPYMEQDHLFKQIDLTKPWNDPGNAAVLAKMPDVYRCPSDPATDNHTNYVGIVGPNAFFQGETPRQVRELLDGTSRTLIIVEKADSDIHWAEPRDIAEANVATDVGSHHNGGFVVTYADGHTAFMSSTIDAAVLQQAVTIASNDDATTQSSP